MKPASIEISELERRPRYAKLQVAASAPVTFICEAQ